MSAATTARSANLTLTVAAIAAVTIATVAQTFEVASIKLNKARRGPLTSFEAPVFELPMAVMPGGRFRLRLVPTRTLIQLAYGVRNFQITGEPSWVNDERYDVDAKAEGTTSSDQIRLMLQALLADRFRLAVRRQNEKGASLRSGARARRPENHPDSTRRLLRPALTVRAAAGVRWTTRSVRWMAAARPHAATRPAGPHRSGRRPHGDPRRLRYR